MSKYQQIESLTSQLKSSSSVSCSDAKIIIDYVKAGEMTEAQWTEAEAAGQVVSDDIIDALESALKKQNRVKHTFKSLSELNNFAAFKNCGCWWVDGDSYSVYAY